MLTPETLDCDEREIVDHSYKILVIGDFACGKFSTIYTFVVPEVIIRNYASSMDECYLPGCRTESLDN